MSYSTVDGLKFYSFKQFETHGLLHGIFTRNGGVSPDPWFSLNVGSSVGDDPPRVNENRRKIFHAMGLNINQMFDVWQVHSSEVVVAEKPRDINSLHEKADAIITNRKNVVLFMRFADCVPILLFDPARQAIGIAHAGWRGTVDNIASAVIRKMKSEFNSKPSDIIGCIGPSIGMHHYPVGSEVVAQVEQLISDRLPAVLVVKQGQVYFDLWETNRINLERAGVQYIEISEQCTRCDIQNWYSHRGENGVTGRFGALISLA